MNVNHAKFKKSLIVEQFQGNYLKEPGNEVGSSLSWALGVVGASEKWGGA